MLADLRIPVEVSVASDSSAGLSMQGRIGLGKAKHIQVQYLWAQEVSGSGQVRLTKVKGELNRADLFTKHPPRATLERHLTHLGYSFVAAPVTNPAESRPT